MNSAALPVRRSPHIVDVLIAERAPRLTASPVWPVVRPALYSVLNYRAAVRMADAIQNLTGAETRVLKGLLAGRAPKEIAAELRIGVTTVRSHLSRIFQKTHPTSQRELLARLVS